MRIMQFDYYLRRRPRQRASVLQREVPQSRCVTRRFATSPGECSSASCVASSSRSLPEMPRKWTGRCSYKSPRVVGVDIYVVAKHPSHFVPSMWHQRAVERRGGFFCNWLVGISVGVGCDAGADCSELRIHGAGTGSKRAVSRTLKDRTVEHGFTNRRQCSNPGVGCLTRG